MPETHQISNEPTHSEIMVVMTALMLAMLLAALDQTIVATALPRIASDLNGLNQLSWVATAYLLTSAVSTPLYGKISDMFGRKRIFMISIVIFLIGSILCGAAQNMTQLIFFRGLQGLGAGGLMTLVMAIIADIIPPRQRGRYQGYFGAVFGVSSVVGPLLGGLFTDHLSWRWVFYINLPIGIFALAAIAARLHLPVHRTEHKVDYLGAFLLAASSVSLLLLTVWGGSKYAWGSSTILGLGIAGAVLAVLFVLWELRAKEPIIPMRLFKNDIFRTSVLLSLVAGIFMFATIIYLPEYQQIVRGDSATRSGLLLLPLVVGLMGASLISGRMISASGKYRIFPIVGSLVTAFGLYLFSHVKVDTNQWLLSLWMLIAGAGIGMFMQVMTLAVQNSVDRSEIGTATSVITFFRSLGSSFGTAIFGAILINRLGVHLGETLPVQPAGHTFAVSNLQSGIANLNVLPPAIKADILEAFARAFHDVFLWGIPFALAAVVLAFFLRESPLRSTHHEAPVLE